MKFILGGQPKVVNSSNLLAVLISWLLAGYISWSLGIGTYVLFSGSHPTKNNQPFIFHLLLGFATIIFLAHIWSLFFKVGWILLVILGLLAILVKWKVQVVLPRPSKSDFYIYLPLIIISLLLSIGAPNNIDEAGYYLPTVRWMEDYPATQGISLLIARLGFNSGFHMLSATFSLKHLFPGGVYELNGFLFLCTNGYLWKQTILQLINSNSHKLPTIFLLALFFPFSFLVPSMDTDYLSIFGSLLVIGWCIQTLFLEEKISHAKFLALSWILGMLCTVKFITILVLIPFAITLLIYKKRPLFLKACLLIAVAILPWIFRNILISGYTIFPIYQIDLWEVPWKMPYEMVKASQSIVNEYAKVEIIRDDYLLSGIKQWSLKSWIPIWTNNQSQYLIGLATIFLTPLSFLVGLVLMIIYRPKHLLLHKQFRWLWICFTAILIFWFLNFPAIRFGWPWILSYGSITIYYFLHWLKAHWPSYIYKLLFLLVLASWIRLSLNSVLHNIPHIQSKLILHEVHVNQSRYTTKTVGAVEFNIAQDNYCNGISLPCMPANNPYLVIPAGNSITDGFRIDESY